MNFNTTLTGNLPFFWKCAEDYLHFNQPLYNIEKKENKTLFITPLESRATNQLTKIIKIVFFALLGIPALVIKNAYRRKYFFKIVTNINEQSQKKVNNMLPLPINSAANTFSLASDPPTPVNNTEIISINKNTPIHNDTIQNNGLIKDNQKINNNEKTAYNIDQVISNILKAKEDGLKVALFVGRTNDQSTPDETGWKWFTLDVGISEESNSENHVQMDFNNRIQVTSIQNLFNKVILDQSVIKFMNSPWSTLSKLLVVDDPDAELIAEAFNGCKGIDITATKNKIDWEKATITFCPRKFVLLNQQEKNEFENWKKRVGTDEVKRHLQEYQLSNPGIANDQLEENFAAAFIRKESLNYLKKTNTYKKLIDNEKQHLKNVFASVEIVTEHPYMQYRSDFIKATGTQKKDIFEKNIHQIGLEMKKASPTKN